MSTPDTTAEFASALEAARKTKGLSYKDVGRAVFLLLGPMAPGQEWLRRWHVGDMAPERADLVVCAALAEVYGVTLSELSPVVADRYEGVRDLLIRVKRCSSLSAAA